MGTSKLLDVWSGETVVFRGQKYFEIGGMWIPAADAVSNRHSLRNWLDRMEHRYPLVGEPFPVHPAVNPQLDARRRWLPGLYPALQGGGNQGWEETLDTTVADGTQISNSTSETIVSPDFNVPAYYMAVGRTLRITASGVSSNVVTTPGTLIFTVRWGGVGGTVLAKSAAIGLDTTARTNAQWLLDCVLTCRAVGSSGSFLTSGKATVTNVLASSGITNNGAFNCLVSIMGSAGAPMASGNAAVTVDTTTAKLLSVTATFSVSTNPTNLTCQQRVIEALN